MTSIELLREKLHNDYGLAFSDSIIVQALEMHKQEILAAFTEGANDGYDGCYDSNKEQYYQETFVSKGSDAAHDTFSPTQHNSPKVENKTSYGDISDEEIEKEINKRYMSPAQNHVWINACKWYREQLKCTGNGEN